MQDYNTYSIVSSLENRHKRPQIEYITHLRGVILTNAAISGNPHDSPTLASRTSPVFITAVMADSLNILGDLQTEGTLQRDTACGMRVDRITVVLVLSNMHKDCTSKRS